MLIYLSVAFDTVDHNILIHTLGHWVGFAGVIIKWLRSYLQDRSFFVAMGTIPQQQYR